MQSDFIIELNEQNFRRTIEQSQQTPVLIHFWSPSIAESTQIINDLQALANKHQGSFILAFLNCESEPTIASQFGVQSLPTIALFSNGQAIDGMAGTQPIESISTMLEKHLPSQDDLVLKSAISAMEQGQHQEALSLLQNLPESLRLRGDIKLAIADCMLETNQFDLAKVQLSSIPLEYQDNYFKGLTAKLELHEQAADSPEIKTLESKLAEEPLNLSCLCDLALQYHQVSRNEEALQLLLSVLKKDLNAHDGEVKKVCMDILSALGQGNTIASKYRRHLYSLLY
ncbi:MULTISPECIES: co-chaperone YbbN [Vibrio]|uniref:Co-chaperone YbbN n=1 Tax=Vibrio casei TaxID=673372 RepID=A0A368LLQ1_9VIBR|nr:MULTISPECIES: co-chaperone YbbN [Vibrio]RCS72840.1 co-chaperone YbbN [Vibrio casei]SJN38883.1 Thioredoxin domain-containing protein EC-YbbN [Vibrio casei]HBV74858.1 co-chaperone YbbN [Vibrio sp.]